MNSEVRPGQCEMVKNALLIRMPSLALALLCTGCASSDYLTNRGADACDILSFGFGYGAGASVQAGPLMTSIGLIACPYGVHGGDAGLCGASEEWGGVVVGRKEVGLKVGCRKEYAVDHYLGVVFPSHRGVLEEDPLATLVQPYELLPVLWQLLANVWPGTWRKHPEVVNVGISVGAGGALRMEFSPLETVDFLLGWVMIDLPADDGHTSARRVRSNSQGVARGRSGCACCDTGRQSPP